MPCCVAAVLGTRFIHYVQNGLDHRCFCSGMPHLQQGFSTFRDYHILLPIKPCSVHRKLRMPKIVLTLLMSFFTALDMHYSRANGNQHHILILLYWNVSSEKGSFSGRYSYSAFSAKSSLSRGIFMKPNC